MRWSSRWLPQSLFGRLMGVLAGGLMLAQLLGAAINVVEREQLLARQFGSQPAQRIADVVTLLDSLQPEERERVVSVFGVPPLVLSLHDIPVIAATTSAERRGALFSARLQAALGESRATRLLARAAQGLGEDIARLPLPEDGPREVRPAAAAFNTIQRRLTGFIDERTRMLAALSHDLKRPLTRMRLSTELLDDDLARGRFETDLREMEAMVAQTLDFMRGPGGHEPRAPLDVDALLASLLPDNEAMGRSVSVEGCAGAPFVGVPSLLRRALGNLIDNAVLYGGAATVRVEDNAERLRLHVLDKGPGIPESELDRVFEPWHRLEGSRSRDTGGTGLGLGIARGIARLHGGDLLLHNRLEGGLEALLDLPRRPGGRPAGDGPASFSGRPLR